MCTGARPPFTLILPESPNSVCYPIEVFPECFAGSLGDRSRPHTPAMGADCPRQILPNGLFLYSENIGFAFADFFRNSRIGGDIRGCQAHISPRSGLYLA